MARWDEGQFVEQAQRIAKRHTTTKESINNLAEKVARDTNLNPDEIRTLVRLSNVAAFQEIFRQKTGGDKMVEFVTGDPETVIRSMVSPDAPAPANVMNDKLASYDVPDQMRAKRFGVAEVTEQTKEASSDEEPTEKPPRRDMVILNLRKIAEELTVEKFAAGQRWETTLDGLTTKLKRPAGYGVTVDALTKDAAATFGSDANHELAYLYENLRRPVRFLSDEKTAELQERWAASESDELNILKTAVEARKQFVELSEGLKWVESRLAQLE